MAIELFSRRNRVTGGSLSYDVITADCRQQIWNIAAGFFERNRAKGFAEEHVWPVIRNTLRDEHGKECLVYTMHRTFGGHLDSSEEVRMYFIDGEDIGHVLDTVEVIFMIIADSEATLGRTGGFDLSFYEPAQAVADLNKRLSQHSIGYKFDGGMLIRIDNELLYDTITKDVLVFLTNPAYHGINEEYMQAHKHFRAGDYKDCIVNCAKAFESTMKIICDKKGYPYDKGRAGAADLLNVLFKQNFIPSYSQGSLTGLRMVLGEGVSVIRNKTSAHGAGGSRPIVDESLTAYAMNSAGSSIKFLLGLLEGK